MTVAKSSNPFHIPRKTPFGVLERMLERIVGLRYISKAYDTKPDGLCIEGFLDFVLSRLMVDYKVAFGDVDNIPKTGATVIVANHPSGCIEGVILAKVLLSVRSDIQILANEFLKMIPELDALFIGVDVFSKDAVKKNAAALKSAHKHLADGGLLLVFPAGEVSNTKRRKRHDYRKRHKYIEDKQWSKSITSLVRKHRATTVPIYIDDKNSKMFYMARKIRPVLGTLMLGRELIRKRNRIVHLRISQAIAYKEIANMPPDDMVQYLRLNTYMMASHSCEYAHNKMMQQWSEPLAEGLHTAHIVNNIQALPKEAFLFTHEQFAVYCTTYDHMDSLAHELGRCREATFRLNAEGTGKPLDLDAFDEYYHHLFIWDREQQKLVGAYRLGVADKIIEKFGSKGLYSRESFQFDRRFVKSLNPDMKAIELGRSFIVPEYQGHRSVLSLLWRGIGVFVSRHPEYTHLFGPVSISSEYTMEARHLMVDVLRKYYYAHDKSKYVSGYKSLPNIPIHWTEDMLGGLECTHRTSAVISRMDDGKSIPVLLRQYLRMNGKIAGFSIDPDFNDSLDGLIVVDMRNMPVKALKKYMGTDTAESYLEYHGMDVCRG